MSGPAESTSELIENRIANLSEGPVVQGDVSKRNSYLDAVVDNSEVEIFVAPGEPTMITFDEKVEGGWKRAGETLSLDKSGKHLVALTKGKLHERGEAIIVELESGTLVAMRIRPADEAHPRSISVTVTVQDRS